MTWLENLKIGDKVIVKPGREGDQPAYWYLKTIISAPKTFVVTEGGSKFSRSDGEQVPKPMGYGSPDCIVEASSDSLAEMREAKDLVRLRTRTRDTFNSRFLKLETSQLESILAILEYKECSTNVAKIIEPEEELSCQ